MYVRLFSGYRHGVALPSPCADGPKFGQLSSQRVRGVQRLELWPHDFATNTRGTTTIEPECLWRPELTAVLPNGFAFTGLERASGRWVIQRWLCEPSSLESILAELEGRSPRA